MPHQQHADNDLLELVELPSGRTEWKFSQPAAAVPPPIGSHKSLIKYRDVHAALMAKGSKSLTPFWWQSPGVDAAIIRQLQEQSYCVVDGFLGGSACSQLEDEVRKVHRAGLLQPATVGQGRMHMETDRQRAAFRSDTVAWFTGSEPHWRVLPAYLELVDHCVGLLRQASASSAASVATSGGGGGDGGVGVTKCLQRSRAMVACYAKGARYAKHCDNVCNAGEGPTCNGRRLTAILYLNDRWTPEKGGELLVYPPLGMDGAAIGRIEPLANRLLFFYADSRVPHEVMPSHAERFAITLWYYDADEVKMAGGGRA